MKECPFCNHHQEHEEGPGLYVDGKGYCVKCSYCGARGPITTTAAKAINKWNNRASTW
jgi:Lar family restriction alleviation protein